MSERLIWACHDGWWSCAYRGLTGEGATPNDARLSLVAISQLMWASWRQAPVQ